MGKSFPISPCERTAPRATFEASVVKMNGSSKLGYRNMGGFFNLSLSVSNAI